MRAANVSTFRHPDIVVMVVHTQPGANKIHTMPSFQQQSTQKKHGPFWLVIFFYQKDPKNKKRCFFVVLYCFSASSDGGTLDTVLLVYGFVGCKCHQLRQLRSDEVTK